jgi:phage-related protein
MALSGAGTESAAQYEAAVRAMVQDVQNQIQSAMAQAAKQVQASFQQLVGTQVKALGDGFKAAATAAQQVDANTRVLVTTVKSLPGDIGNFVNQARQAGPQLLTIGKNALDSSKEVVSMTKELVALPKTFGAIGEVTKAWKLAQEGVNVAFRSNPIGFVIAIVQKFLPLLINLIQNNATLRAAVEKAFTLIGKIISTVMSIVEKVIVAAWPIIEKVFQSAMTVIAKVVNVVWPAIQAIIAGVSAFIQALIQRVWPAIVGIIRGAVEFIHTTISTVFNAVMGVVNNVWNTIRNTIATAVNNVIAIIHGIEQVWTIIKEAFGRAVTAVSDAIGSAVSFVAALPGRVLGAIGNFGSLLYNTGRDLIMGLINGITNMAGQLLATIKNFIVDHIPGPIKSILGISSPSKLMAGYGQNIGEGLAQGIEGSTGLVATAMNKLVPAPKPVSAIAGMAGLAQSSLQGLGSRLTATGGAAMAAGAGAVAVNVYPQQGQSEYEIGRIAAREVAWAGKR